MQQYKILLVIILSLLVGCVQQVNPPEGFYSYDHTEINEMINQLSFNPIIPPFLPINVEFLVTDRFFLEGTEKEAMDVSFYTKENNILTFQATEGSFDLSINGKEVQIDKHVKGNYADNRFAKSLYWEKENISYSLIFRSNMNNDEIAEMVTKEDLIKVAQAI
ncbi:hypothetical protein BN1058_01381 [Paraliobacillus sp. PM-2]|uniref:hypothetical protein n=1 Tax=Paraliobacillus sp. PM-2 TaxID=1462524 RepID=UPI00061C48A9|nr:hypothetical protein [Paraliobacillus sp. PM-2]CQR47092.1 hypothetical protein BN1058_01381 [Paraliobacillus sp. PM-2]